MEENKNVELQEQQQAAQNQQEDMQELLNDQSEEIQETEEHKTSSNGRFLLWILAGVYLLYTSYTLCMGYISGDEESNIGFMLIGIVFAVIAVGLLVTSVRNLLSGDKLKKAKVAKDAAMEAAAGGELKKENAAVSEQHKPMSIADRANLAKRLEDEEEDKEE